MLSKTFVLCAAFVASAIAQGGKLAFTTLPSSVKVNDTVTLRWAGGDNTPVTITLKQGSPNNLQTIDFVARDATGSSYPWNVQNVPEGSNYALQITQDGDEINFTGLFSITGGSDASSSASSSAASSTSAAASSTPSSSTNATTTITSRPSGTGIVGTAGTGVGSAGTGVSQSRNTTLSRATLSASSSSASATTTSDEASSTEGMGSPTESESPAPSPSSGVGSLSSNVGLLLAGIAAVAYLG